MIYTAQFRGRQGYLSSPSIKEWSIGAADAALMHVFIQILNLWTYYTHASLEMVLVINLAASLSLLLMFRSARLTSAPGPAPRKESSDAREEEPSSRQQRICEGFRAYVRQCFGEYLSPAELEQIEKIRKELGTQFCRRCNYCQPCTAGINISGSFLFEGYYNRYGLQDWAKGRYLAMAKTASDCVDCGLCEERCPYNLPIREMLKKVSTVFGK